MKINSAHFWISVRIAKIKTTKFTVILMLYLWKFIPLRFLRKTFGLSGKILGFSVHLQLLGSIPGGNYKFKVNNRNTRIKV